MDERAAGAVVYLTGDLDRNTLEKAVRAGTLQRVRRGAYGAVVESEDRYVRERVRARQQMHAIARQLEGPLWFSHDSAALLHRLPLDRVPSRTHLLRPGRASARADQTIVRHRAAVAEADMTMVDALPVTTVLRTAVDCAMTMSDLGAFMVLDRVLAEPGLREQIADRLAGRRGASGSAKARWRLDRADRRAESAGETATRETRPRWCSRRSGARTRSSGRDGSSSGWCGPIWPAPAGCLPRCTGGSRSGQPGVSGSGECAAPAMARGRRPGWAIPAAWGRYRRARLHVRSIA